MKFMAKFDNVVYVVEPKDLVFLPGGKVNRVPGVKAVFSGPNHIFDSDIQAKRWKWNADLKKQVEEHLITHDDFGRDIYLAPGEELPEEYRDVVSEKMPQASLERRCQRIEVEGDEFDQCKNTAIYGTDFCEEHRPQGISQGLGTTTR